MLNVQQEKFCVEFVSNGGNGQQAYQAVYGADANTARVNASRLLKKSEVQERLKELQAEANSEKILSAQELKERLSAIGRREVTETIFLPNGEQVQKPVAIRDAIRAMETLARISGLYATKPEVDVKNQVVVIVDDI